MRIRLRTAALLLLLTLSLSAQCQVFDYEKNSGAQLQPRGQEHVRADVVILSDPNQHAWHDPDFWVNVALALAGFLGIGVALATLLKIRAQADEMKLQHIAMQETLVAIKHQADLMSTQAGHMEGQISQAKAQVALLKSQNKAVQNRERARLRLVFPPSDEPNFIGASRIRTDEGIELDILVRLYVENMGISKAFGVRVAAGFHIQEKDSPFVAEPLGGIVIPNVILESSMGSPVPIEMTSLVNCRLTDAFLDAKGDFYVYGKLSYRDVFEIPHTTPFQFMWTMEDWHDSDGTRYVSNEGWENQSGPST